MSPYGNPLTEYSPQMEAFEYSGEYAGERESGPVFNEQQEMELAAEFLEISNEQELENFLGGLIDTAGKAIGGFVRSPLGQQLDSRVELGPVGRVADRGVQAVRRDQADQDLQVRVVGVVRRV